MITKVPNKERELLKAMMEYKVGRGDTLSGLAKKMYGKEGRWKEIYAANRGVLSNPNRIKAGQRLRIPGMQRVAPEATPSAVPETARPSAPTVAAARPTPQPAPQPSEPSWVTPTKFKPKQQEIGFSEGEFPVYPAKGFVFHHSGGSSLSSLRETLKQRGLGSQYLMDRDGTIYNFGGAGSPHMRPNDEFRGAAPGLRNENAVGMEIVARDDHDITPAQVRSARWFIEKFYPETPIYGHGEVNPGHKQATEGLTVTNAIRQARKDREEIGMSYAMNTVDDGL